MKHASLIVICAILALFVVFGCTQPVAPGGDDGGTSDGGGGGTTPDPASAAALFDEGMDAMNSSDFTLAYTKFELSYAADNTYYPAVLASSLLELTSATVDPDLVDFVKNDMGVADYPSNMTDAFAGSWMVDVYNGDGDPIGTFPDITGQEDYDGYFDGGVGDGYIDGMERLAAVINNLIAAGVTGNDVSDLVTSTLEQVLATVSSRLAAVPASATLTIDWNLLGMDEADWGPQDELGNPMPIVVGKAEISLIYAELQMIRASLAMTKAIDLAFPYEDVWTAIDPDTGEFTPPSTGPFAQGFLDLRTGYATEMETARTHMTNAVTTINTAAATFAARSGTAFTIDEQSSLFDDPDAPDWTTDIVPGLTFIEIATERMSDSLTSPDASVDAVFPANVDDYFVDDGDGGTYFDQASFFGYYDDEANWPSEGDVILSNSGDGPQVDVNAVAINFGAIYDTDTGPLRLLLDVDTDGEPVIYRATIAPVGSPAAPSFAEVTDPYSYDPDELYYVKLPDLTFGGVCPLSTLPAPGNINQALNVGDANPFDTDGNEATENPLAWFSEESGKLAVYLAEVPQLAGHVLVTPGNNINIPDPETLVVGTPSVGSYWWALADFLSWGAPATISRFTDATTATGGTDSATAAEVGLDTWYEDSVSAGSSSWFKLTSLPAGTYRVFKNDGLSGNGKYSAEISVEVFASDGTTSLADGDSNVFVGLEFTIASAGTVYVKISDDFVGGGFAFGVERF